MRALVEDAIACIAERFLLHGWDEARSIKVGVDGVHFGTCGATVKTLDLDSFSCYLSRSRVFSEKGFWVLLIRKFTLSV